jgi:putative addiction module component (TIGR02574 family)
MTHTIHDFVLTTLSLPERAELAQELWDSVHADACAAPFTPEQLVEIDRRVAALDAGEMTCEPWETVRTDLLKNT